MTAPHERLRARLGDPALYLDDPADTARYARDWIGKYVGTAPLVVRPRSTDEVAAVLAACTELDVPVVPQAGNTGMVGGGVPRAGEVVLSVERLNAIEAFDEASATVQVQAGVVLETLQNYLAERGYDMPVDLGGRGSCQIGGMIATNAGGVKVLRYGHMREQVRGLEVVLADGTVVSGLNILKKNNTGLDLKQVFIGSEGTLGVITRPCCRCSPRRRRFRPRSPVSSAATCCLPCCRRRERASPASRRWNSSTGQPWRMCEAPTPTCASRSQASTQASS